jgi:hypothetical protein
MGSANRVEMLAPHCCIRKTIRSGHQFGAPIRLCGGIAHRPGLPAVHRRGHSNLPSSAWESRKEP